jgi:hypothetical protein
LVLIALAIFIISSFSKKGKNLFCGKDLLRYKYKKVEKKNYYCPLCDVKVNEEVKKRVLSVKIENSPKARPQSGLDKACVVYEFLTEGGITRFNAFYLCEEASKVGPVRSARFPDLILLKQYSALFAHCGGSAPVLKSLRSGKGYLDLDQMRYESAYWRVSSRRRPHNLYTSTYKLRELAGKLGYEKEESFAPLFSFKEDNPLTTPTVTYISIPYSPWSNARFVYDSKENRYLRYIGKKPHLDAESGKQLWAKNVIVFFTTMRATGFRDSHGSRVVDFKLTGEGEAWFFIDGGFVKGKWEGDESKPPRFFDEGGNEIKFNRGSIWIEVVPTRIKPVVK